MIKTTLLMFAAGVIAAGVAAPAHADSDDDATYLRILRDHGIAIRGTDQDAINFAHNVCDGLARGYSMNALEDVSDTGESHGLTDADVKVLIKTAAAVYCPERIP